MFRFYLACVGLGLALFGGAQYRGWSIMPTEAEEYARARAEALEQGSGRSGSGGRSGGFSGK
jgi:hypothetical protein